MKVYMMQQTSPEWWAIKKGIPTASEFKRIIRAKDGTLSKSRKAYIAELLAQHSPNYFSQRGVFRGTKSMQNGKDIEGEARHWYAMATGYQVQQVGFCMADSETYGCSPDGVIGLRRHELADTCEGTLELKCPDLDTQFLRLLEDRLPPDHKAQVHGQLVVTGANWVDWCSYAPGANGLIKRVEPDDYTARVKEAVEQFVDELLTEARRLGVMLGAAPVF